jgi:uncharacterized membrane protein
LNLPGRAPMKLEEWTVRIGFLGTGMVLFNVALDLWAQGQPDRHPLVLGMSCLAWAMGIALMILAMLTNTKSRSMWVLLVALLFAQLAYAYLLGSNYTPLTGTHTDNEMVAEYAAEALQRGENPYDWDYSDMLRAFRDRGLNVTPFLDGAFQHRLTYPALSTLLLAGLDYLGIGQPRTLCLVFQLVLLVLLFLGAPAALRPVVLLPLFLIKDIVFLSLTGVQDIVWSTLLVSVILAWKRPVWRALLFGLACAYRQQPWFAAPFLLILLWNEPGAPRDRWRRVAQFGTISLGTFALINLPFVLWNPRAWWLGAFEPAFAPFNVYSHGLGALSQFGLAPFPRPFYTALQISFYLIALAVHWRHPRSVGQAFWLFPAVFFWLYYRGLASYWIYWIPPLLLATLRRLPDEPCPKAVGADRAPSWRRTTVLGGALLLPCLVWGAILLPRRPSLSAGYSLPLQVIDYGQKLVDRMTVTVSNTSDEGLAPRFAVQRDPGVQALPWAIESGPALLPSGQSADYVISARTPGRAFPVEEGGQIVVTHAGSDYWRRVVQEVPADRTFAQPDMIVNPSYHFWPHGGDAPAEWSLLAANGGAVAARIESIEGRTALVVQLAGGSGGDRPAEARLAQTITLAEFSIWVYRTEPAQEPLEGAFGLELDDGQHKLWVLFGDSEEYGLLNEDHGYVTLPAPFKMWSEHAVRPQELYQLFGWPLPPMTPRHRNGLIYPARQAQLSLLVASRSHQGSRGVFGPIEQEPPGSDLFLDLALSQPDAYYASVGDEYRGQRNYELAQDAYLEALVHNAASPQASFGLGEARFWLGDYHGALGAFEASLRHDYPQPALPRRGMGWSYYNLGRYEEAMEAFAEAALLEPDLADAHNGLGWSLLQMGRCDEALPFFERAQTLAPDFPDPQLGIAECQNLH